jgi:hypothetical protein
MSGQDDWVKVTLRLPPQLHQKITDAVAVSQNSKSLNLEIVGRLAASLMQPQLYTDSRFSVDLANPLEKYWLTHCASMRMIGSSHKSFEEANFRAWKMSLENNGARVNVLEAVMWHEVLGFHSGFYSTAAANGERKR